MTANVYYDILSEELEMYEMFYTASDDAKKRKRRLSRIRIYDGDSWEVKSFANRPRDEVDEELKKLLESSSVKNQDNIDAWKKMIGNRSEEYRSYVKKETDKDKIFRFLSELDGDLEGRYQLIYKQLYLKKTFETDTIKKEFSMESYGVGLKEWDAERDGLYTRCTSDFDRLSELRSYFLEYDSQMTSCTDASPTSLKPYEKIVFSPEATGILVHECFGHVFEADNRYQNDRGEQICNPSVSIFDDGYIEELGYTPFDDDGMSKVPTCIIENGKINSYLTDVKTSSKYSIPLTGNGRAVHLKETPLVRMTNTYMKPGSMSKDMIFNSVDEGLYIIRAEYGEIRGNGDFVIMPKIAQVIRNGKLCEYVKCPKIAIQIIQLFDGIKLIADDLEFTSTLFGGCGKRNQFPLSVSQGGPHCLVESSDFRYI